MPLEVIFQHVVFQVHTGPFLVETLVFGQQLEPLLLDQVDAPHVHPQKLGDDFRIFVAELLVAHQDDRQSRAGGLHVTGHLPSLPHTGEHMGRPEDDDVADARIKGRHGLGLVHVLDHHVPVLEPEGLQPEAHGVMAR